MVLGGCTLRSKTKPKMADVPTLCLHGLGGSYQDELPFVREAEKKKVSNCVIRANVNKHGQVKMKGKIKADSKNPIIMVNYKDNVQPNFARNGFYVTQVVKALRKKYVFKKINMVGYSLGNMSIMYYQLLNREKANMPSLKRQVDIAGHFDGAAFPELPASYRSPNGLVLDSVGKPNKMNQTYQQMLPVRRTYAHEKIQVLNLMGNFANDSDGVVPNNSSRSLRYLVAGKNYHEIVFKGPDSSHGGLIKNQRLIHAAIEFLWHG